MLRLLLLLLLAMPVQAGVRLIDKPVIENKDPNKIRQWTYHDGLFEIILTDRQTKECGQLRLMRSISVGDYVRDGCWQELDALVYIRYENGQQSAISADKFKETKIDSSPVLKTQNFY